MTLSELINLYEKKIEDSYNKVDWEQYYRQFIDIKELVPKEQRKEEVKSNGVN